MEGILLTLSYLREGIVGDGYTFNLREREREMLHLMAQGASNAEISRLLSLSVKTVANYVSNILHKLQVADRKEAAVRAREAGLGEAQP